MRIGDRVKPKTPPVAPGVYMAVCIGVVDLGEQYSERFKTYSNRIKFVWALPTELIEVDGKMEERQLSREFGIATKSGSKLRSFLGSWNGKSYTDEEFTNFDPMVQLGKSCQLSVVHNDTGEYANVDAVMPIPKGFPEVVSKTAKYRFDFDDWSEEDFNALPEWVQKAVQKSTQWREIYAPTTDVAVQPEPVQADPVAPASPTIPVAPAAPAAPAGGAPF